MPIQSAALELLIAFAPVVSKRQVAIKILPPQKHYDAYAMAARRKQRRSSKPWPI